MVDVRHQLRAHCVIQRALASKRMSHAYLFYGPEGVGKEMLAVRLCRLLMCESTQALSDAPAEYAGHTANWLDSCAQCRSCQLAAAGAHPDIHVIHRYLGKFHPDATVRNRKALDLGIDVIRHFVIDPIAKKPTLGRGKAFVLRESERLTPSAQNALLKTLEEPPPGSYVILLTNALERLIPTIRSRAQRVPFGLLPGAFVASLLESLRPTTGAEERHYVSHHEPGSPGRALWLLDNGFLSCNGALIDGVVGLQRRGALALAARVEELAQRQAEVLRRPVEQADRQRSDVQAASALTDRDAMRQALSGLLGMLAGVYRDVLKLQVSANAEICNRPHLERLRGLALSGAPFPAGRAITAVARAEYQLNQNATVRLCLDHLAVQLARLHGQ